jgi:UDP-3-O-[3-hydroxymyristoyl] N-acetylglucosamine deacetylase/3-hydroxyacyl-[acyl-carrier-protein] dehydratase
MRPAAAGRGIVFRRTDLDGSPEVTACTENMVGHAQRSGLAQGAARVELTEHVLSALAGLGIDDAVIDVDAAELPLGDGSAIPFTDAISAAGVVDQSGGDENTQVTPLRVTEPVTVSSDDMSILATPAPRGVFEIVYVLDYGGGNAAVPACTFSGRVKRETFIEELAPARTFTTRAEAEAARSRGMFTHLTENDVLVFDGGAPMGQALRFDDEPARHKALDLIGDLALTGRPIEGRFVAHRSGHELNRALACELIERERSRAAGGTGLGALAIADILRLMPHRYPMLLVDRVLEIEGARRAVGVKNVTINEPFFQGHYPGDPIMPGVLQIEAMAQLAGLMLHEKLEHAGKVALLLSVENVKWRRPVLPGDCLVIEAEAVRGNARMADVQCSCRVEGEIAAEARIKMLMADRAAAGRGPKPR